MAEPDIATSADEEQNLGILDTVASNIAEIPEAVAQGAVKGLAEIDDKVNAVTGGALDTVGEWMNENLFDLGNIGTDEDGGIVYYRVAEAMKQAKELGLENEEFDAYVKDKAQKVNLTDGVETFTGNVTAGLSQFAMGWIPANRALSVFNTTTKATQTIRLMIEGAAAELLAFDKHEERLSNFLADNEVLKVPYAEYLAADPDDGTAEALFKQAVEGVLIEGAAGLFIASVKAIKANRNNYDNTNELVQEAVKEAETLVPTLGNDIDEAMAAWEEANQAIVKSHDEAVTMPSPDNQKKRAEGRSEAVAAMTDDQLDDLRSRGGAITQTNEEMIASAKISIGQHLAKYGDNTEQGIQDWITRFGGDVVRARKTLARAVVLADVADVNFGKVVEKYNKGEATHAEAVNAMKQVIASVNIARGGFSEAGRMLEFSKVVDGWNINTVDTALKAGTVLRSNLKGRKKFYAQMAKYAINIQNAGSAGIGMINELFINSILSGFKTHAVNIGSNTYTMLTMPMEKAIGAAIKGNRADMVKALRMYQGFAYGSLSSAKGAYAALKSGQTKLDADYSIMEDGKMVKEGYIPLWAGGGIIRAPTRLLAAEDEFFKQINFRAFVYSEAVTAGRELIKRGEINPLTEKPYTKADLAKYVDDEVEKAVNIQMEQAMTGRASDEALAPTADAAIQYGRTTTFTQGLDGKVSQGISKAVTDFPILRQINPFVRTPLNLLSYTVQRSPLFLLSGRWRRDFMAGGTRQGEAITRASVGSGLAYYFYNLALEDKITGSGETLTTDQLKGLQDIAGYDKNSVITEDGYANVQRLSPALDLMTIMASIHELNKFGNKDAADEMAMGVTMVITEMMRDKSFMQGIDDFFNAIDEPERYGTSYMANRAGALIPYSGLLKSINQELADPKNRKIWTVLDGFYRNTPGLSDALDPHYNILGEEKFVPEFYGVDSASPVGFSELKDNPLADEWMNALENGIPYNVGMPPTNKDGIDLTDRAFATDTDGKPLNPERERGTAYGEWMRRTGLIKAVFNLQGVSVSKEPVTLREALTKLVQHPSFVNNGTANIRIGDRVYTGTKEQLVKETIKSYRKISWALMVGQNPYEDGSGVFGQDDVLYEVKGKPPKEYKDFPIYQKLAIAYWTNHRAKGYFANSKEGQDFMKSREQKLNSVLTGGTE
jgi:hypothetical protein